MREQASWEPPVGRAHLADKTSDTPARQNDGQDCPSYGEIPVQEADIRAAAPATGTGEPGAPATGGDGQQASACSAQSPYDAADGPALIRHLLQDQQELTAVERFAQQHDAQRAGSTGDGRLLPSRSASDGQTASHGGTPRSHYAHLMPASPPAEGQQYAFHVDLDRCSGCKACVTACHSLNGLDDGETWRDVGLLIGGTTTNPVLQHVTTACHHCLEPACLAACPVDAYEKDPLTGIVQHLDDQCFGCQYCTLACPYDVPKYHKAHGIVRKCDLCSDRLSAGEAPACVQACPHEAIAIQTVETERVIEDSEAVPFLPTTPEPDITYPTTTYSTNRRFPRNLLPADYYSLRPQHPHWPLIVMLVLTQLSVGAWSIGLLLDGVLDPVLAAAMRPVHTGSALVFGLVALTASVFHLGRPQYAFRAVIGLKHSWLSREILAFGVFAALACFYPLTNALPLGPGLREWLGWSVAAAGLAGVFCSVMIYVFTQRALWAFPQTGMKFLLTSLLLGLATTWLTVLLLEFTGTGMFARQLTQVTGDVLAKSLLVVAGTKLLMEAGFLRHLCRRRMTALKRSALLMTGVLSNVTIARFACGLLGGIVMPVFLLTRGQTVAGAPALNAGAAAGSDPVLLIVVSMLFVFCLLGELLERYLFFAAVSPSGMPGGLR